MHPFSKEISSVSRKISLVSLPLLYALDDVRCLTRTEEKKNRLFPTDDDIHSIVVSFPKRPELLSMRDGSVSSFPRGTKAVLFLFLFLLLFVVVVVFFFESGSRTSTEEETKNRFYNERVREAPPASLSSHQSNAQFTDQRGSYLRFEPTDKNENNLYVNVVFSKKGSKRSGDVHKCTQVNHVVFGRVSLTTTKKPFAVGEGERTIEYFKDDVIRIQPHVPHIYEFKEDTIFTENWEHEDGSPCEFKAWLYEPFRSRISSASLVRTL